MLGIRSLLLTVMFASPLLAHFDVPPFTGFWIPASWAGGNITITTGASPVYDCPTDSGFGGCMFDRYLASGPAPVSTPGHYKMLYTAIGVSFDFDSPTPTPAPSPTARPASAPMNVSTLPINSSGVVDWIGNLLAAGGLVSAGALGVIGARYFPTAWRAIAAIFGRR